MLFFWISSAIMNAKRHPVPNGGGAGVQWKCATTSRRRKRSTSSPADSGRRFDLVVPKRRKDSQSSVGSTSGFL